MRNHKMMSYEWLRLAKSSLHRLSGVSSEEQGVMKRLIGDALNAPKFLYLVNDDNAGNWVTDADGREWGKDEMMGRDMMTAGMFTTPFDKYVIESYDEDNNERMVFFVNIAHNQRNAFSAEILVVHKDGEWGTVVRSTFICNTKEVRVLTFSKNNASQQDSEVIVRTAVRMITGLSAALVQCQANTTRHGFKHRTSRHPVPQEWDGQPFYTYTIVHKERNPLPAVRMEAHPTGIKQRRHLRMGHWRFKNNPDKRRWIEPYYAGDAKLGFVFKDYDIPTGEHK